jgi:predicted aspartyl protease
MKTKYWGLVLTLTLLGPLLAIAQEEDKSFLLRGELLTKNNCDTLQIEFYQQLPILETTVFNRRVRFLIDTGAPTLISRQLQGEIQADTIAKKNIEDVNGFSDSIAFVSIKEISLGNLHFQNIPAGVFDFKNDIWKCIEIDGIIGSNLLQHTVVIIDGQAEQLILCDQLKETPKQKPLSITFSNQKSPLIKIKPGPRTSEELLVDTGFNDLYSLCARNYIFFQNRKRLKNTRLSSAIGHSSIGLLGGTKIDTVFLLQLKYLKINNVKILRPIVSTSNDQNSKLGSGIIRYGKMILDYPGQRFWFIPYTKLRSENNTYWGFEPSAVDGHFVIGLVWQNSNASRSGLMSGQKIISINNYNLESNNFCETIRTWSNTWSRKNELILEVENEDGRVNTITLSKETVK